MDLSDRVCALCKNAMRRGIIEQEQLFFCCHGCLAVFNILTAASALENFKTHPIFLQAVKFGIISNPELLEGLQRERKQSSQTDIRKWNLEVGEMWCPSCGLLIELCLQKVKGVIRCSVDYATDLASIEFFAKEISKEEIHALISSLGYQPKELSQDTQVARRYLSLRLLIASFCALNVMMFSYPLYATYFFFDGGDYGFLFALLSLLFSIPVVTYCAFPIFRRFYFGLRVGLVGMEGLVTIGVSAAFFLSLYELMNHSTLVYFDSMTAIVVFVLLGKTIESKAKLSTKDTLLRLNRGLPRKGRKRFENGQEKFVPLKEIQIGDTLSVAVGEKIVLDGIVEEGEGSVDESLMTGESLGVIKAIGTSVLAGTILQSGHLRYRVTSNQDESALNRIIDLIKQDIGHKTIYASSIDLIAASFTPLVILIAFGTILASYFLGFSIEDSLTRAIAVLLISCPCAIGIAAPLVESNLIQKLAELGVLVRNRGALQYVGKENFYIFDKTGTITEGKFQVLKGFENLSQEHTKALIALASHSSHPIASAIANYQNVEKVFISQIIETPGCGMEGWIGDKHFLLGSEKLMERHGIDVEKNSFSETPVFFAMDQTLLTTLILGDKIKEQARTLMNFLSGKKSILLSGDAKEVVERIGGELCFTESVWRVSPLEKRTYIDKLKQKGDIILMVGDGINDAPAITAAHIGISFVSASDISIQVSDLLLTSDKLSVLSDLTCLVSKAKKLTQQNFFWAFFYNVIGIGLALTGVLSPIFAAFAMVASSLIVLFNSKRL